MGVFDQFYVRIKVIVILIGFLFFVGTCEAIFFGVPQDDSIYGDFGDQEKMQQDYESVSNPRPPPPESLGLLGDIIDWFIGAGEIIVGIGVAFGNFLGMLYGAITFTISPAIPLWMTMIMAPIMVSVTMIVVYIIIDIIYDIVKSAPTT